MADRLSGLTLVRNSTMVGIASFWQVASGILLTPLIIGRMGLEGYGVWTLLFGVTGTMTSFSGSMSLAYTKFTAEYVGRGNFRELSGLLGSGVAMIGGASALGLGGIWLVRVPVLSGLGVPDTLLADASSGLTWVLAGLFVRLSFGCFRRVLSGLQRTDLQYHARILASVTYLCLGLLLLAQGMGIEGLAAAFFTGEISAAALAWFHVRRIQPDLRISLFCVSLAGMKSFFALGGRFQALRLFHQAANDGIRMLLSALMGPAMLGTYELARKLIDLGQTASSSITAPMMPAFAELHASRQDERMRRLYHHGSRLLFVSGLVSLGFLAVFADSALLLWTGEPQPLSAWTLRVLAIGFIAKPLTGMGTASLRGRGRVGLELRTSALALGLRVVLLVPFYLVWGFQGIVTSAPLAGILGSLCFLWLYSRSESLSFGEHLREVVWRPSLVLGPILLAAFFWSTWFQLDLADLSVRWDAFVTLLIDGCLFTIASAAACWWLLLRPDERAALALRARSLLSRGRRSRSAAPLVP